MVNRGNFHGKFNKARGRGGRGNRNGRGCGSSFRGNNHRSHGNHSNENQSLYRPEPPTETDVGITEYISSLEGFSAIIKSRFSDFHVNEIDLDDIVAKLTNTNLPKEFQKGKVEVPLESPLQEISQEQWVEIKAMIESTDDSKSVKIDVTNNDKETRSMVHKTLKSIFQKNIISNTVEEGDVKYIELKRMTGKNKHDRPDEWPLNLPIYTHFLLYKESVDTMNAIMNIADAIRINSTAFNYAGVKDKRAKTTQWISCKKLEPGKLLYKTKRLRNIKIGNITFKDVPLKLGQLDGNLFRLALREITVDDDIINTHLEQLNEHGFINYYGLQRFGNNKTIPTHHIGVKLLQGNFKEACSLILKPKNYDNPLSGVTQAKKVYEETHNAKEAVKKLKSNESIEAKLIQGLANSGKNDYVTALESIPRNMRLMYIHAFQSLIWNQVVSKRVKEHGIKVIVGDLVLLPEAEKAETNFEGEKKQTGEDTLNNDDAKIEKLEIVDSASQELNLEDELQSVKVLTDEDLPNYTIYDCVLPLPGYNVIYPEYLKDYYRELLGKYNLELEMPQQRVKCYTLSGTYRRFIAKPKELEWFTMKYNDPRDTLIRSDFEEILQHKEPESYPDGKFKALIVSFKLESSSYATMLLREMLKIDTSFNNKTNNKLNEDKIVDEASEDKGSLLKDKSKFDAFKKLIEDGGGDDNEQEIVVPTKRPAENDTCDSKRVKLNDDEDDEAGIKMQPSLV